MKSIFNSRPISKLHLILFTALIVGISFYVYRQDLHRDVFERKIINFIAKHRRALTNPPTTLPFKIDSINNLCNSSTTYKEHTKVLSYSVFGTNPKYLSGIPRVIEIKRNSSFYKDWIVRVYHEGNIPSDMLEKIDGTEDVQLCNAHNLPHYGDLSDVVGYFRRFVAMADPSVGVVCLRDLDSDILLREEDAVKEFMESDAVLHTMRDNPSHSIPMLAGMWCYKNLLNRVGGKYYWNKMLEEQRKVKESKEQGVLNRVLFTHAAKMEGSGMSKIMQHDSYHCKRFGKARPFPKQRRQYDFFVGRPRSEGSFGDPVARKNLVCPVECRPSHGKDWEIVNQSRLSSFTRFLAK